MKDNLTDITIVLDRSGSMATVADDTKHGFDQFVKEQQECEGEANLTLVQFDTEYEFVHEGKNINDIPPLDFHPRGMTALLDAMGKAIAQTGERLSKMSEEERPGKVVFVIFTDGQENSSKEFKKATVTGMIKNQTDNYKWQFVFLGANQDAIAEAGSFGINHMSAMSYAATGQGMGNTMSSTSKNINKFRTGEATNVAYSAKDREEAMEGDEDEPKL